MSSFSVWFDRTELIKEKNEKENMILPLLEECRLYYTFHIQLDMLDIPSRDAATKKISFTILLA